MEIHPKDPYILLSWVNTQLRDYYSSLSELCEDKGMNQSQLERELAAIDMHYNPITNQFR